MFDSGLFGPCQRDIIVCGCIVSWKSILQNIVALSTTEAEYVAIVEATKEALWLKDLVSELGMNQRKCNGILW